jgi:hypothetical protein
VILLCAIAFVGALVILGEFEFGKKLRKIVFLAGGATRLGLMWDDY